MDEIIDRIVEKYIAEAKKENLLQKEDYPSFSAFVEETVFNHYQNNPESTFEEALAAIPSPNDLLNLFDSSVYVNELKRKKKQRNLIGIFAVGLVVLIAVVSFILYGSLKDNYVSVGNNYEQFD